MSYERIEHVINRTILISCMQNKSAKSRFSSLSWYILQYIQLYVAKLSCFRSFSLGCLHNISDYHIIDPCMLCSIRHMHIFALVMYCCTNAAVSCCLTWYQTLTNSNAFFHTLCFTPNLFLHFQGPLSGNACIVPYALQNVQFNCIFSHLSKNYTNISDIKTAIRMYIVY